MIFDVLTLFPEIFESPLNQTLLKRAREMGKLEVRLYQIRNWASDRHRKVDDAPYGGGDGMVMKPEILIPAIEEVKSLGADAEVILLSPQGRVFDQKWAKELSQKERVILVCGRYAGLDERIITTAIDEELSIGDYVLSGGELPALVVIEACARLLPGVLGNEESAETDSFPKRLEYPQYTRPSEFRGKKVPAVLFSGNHQEISQWRILMSLLRTFLRRPDLLESYPLTEEEKRIVEEFGRELGIEE